MISEVISSLTGDKRDEDTLSNAEYIAKSITLDTVLGTCRHLFCCFKQITDVDLASAAGTDTVCPFFFIQHRTNGLTRLFRLIDHIYPPDCLPRHVLVPFGSS